MVKFVKNILITALICLAAAILAACGYHAHEFTYETVSPATCTTAGAERGKCGCGETDTRSIPALGHEYGDWKVISPTRVASGFAVKSCTRTGCGESVDVHAVTVTLPRKSDPAYKVERTLEPCFSGVGKITYTYSHELGDITFTEDIPKLELIDTATAVLAASEYYGEIRHVTGVHKIPDRSGEFEYEAGADYIHYRDGITDGQGWYAVDGGEKKGGFVFDAQKTVELMTVDDVFDFDDSYLRGAPFYFTIASGTEPVSYGAADYLAALYARAKSDKSAKLEEKARIKTVGAECSFSYRYINTDGDLCDVEVAFALNGKLALSSFTSSVKCYPASGESYTESDWADYTPKKTAKTYSYTLEIDSESDISNYKYPFTSDMRFASFEVDRVTVSGSGNTYTPATQDAPVHIPYGESARFEVRRILPETAEIGYDGLLWYYVSGGRLRRVTYDDAVFRDTYMNGGDYCNGSYYICDLRGLKIGAHTIVVKSVREGFEYRFGVVVDRIAPVKDTLLSEVRLYNDGTDSLNWAICSEARMYVGNKIAFRAVAKENCYDPKYTAAVTSGGSAELTVDGSGISYFTADTPGTYTVTVSSAYAPNVTTDITVTVEPAPDAYYMLSGYYSSVNDRYTAEFTPVAAGSVKGTVAVKDNKTDNRVVMTYEYDGTLKTKYSSGNSSLGWFLEITPYYALRIAVINEFTEETQSLAVLEKRLPDYNPAVGTYVLDGTSAGSRLEVNITIAGDYRFDAPAVSANYSVNGGAAKVVNTDAEGSRSITLPLKAGDKVEWWYADGGMLEVVYAAIGKHRFASASDAPVQYILSAGGEYIFTADTASTAFTVYKNGVSVGTFTGTASVTFEKYDMFRCVSAVSEEYTVEKA